MLHDGITPSKLKSNSSLWVDCLQILCNNCCHLINSIRIFRAVTVTVCKVSKLSSSHWQSCLEQIDSQAIISILIFPNTGKSDSTENLVIRIACSLVCSQI